MEYMQAAHECWNCCETIQVKLAKSCLFSCNKQSVVFLGRQRGENSAKTGSRGEKEVQNFFKGCMTVRKVVKHDHLVIVMAAQKLLFNMGHNVRWEKGPFVVQTVDGP